LPRSTPTWPSGRRSWRPPCDSPPIAPPPTPEPRHRRGAGSSRRSSRASTLRDGKIAAVRYYPPFDLLFSTSEFEYGDLVGKAISESISHGKQSCARGGPGEVSDKYPRRPSA
jgi:hypothetical protein